MKAILCNKDQHLKIGDNLIFGEYGGMPIKWHVIDIKRREHKALLIADSYCGKAKNYKNMDSVFEQIDIFKNEWFSVDEQKLICAIRLFTVDDISKYSFSKDDLKFYPYGTGNDAEPYWYYDNDNPTYYYANFVRTDGSLLGICNHYVLSLRPVMWIKYDCVPAEKDTGEEQK